MVGTVLDIACLLSNLVNVRSSGRLRRGTEAASLELLYHIQYYSILLNDLLFLCQISFKGFLLTVH